MHEDNEFDSEIISKSQIKREMLELQDLGEKLTTQTRSVLTKCELPAVLDDAIEEYKRIPKKHGSRKRQLGFIGKLMRTLSEEDISRIHQQMNQNVELHKKRFHQLEELRDALINNSDEAFAKVLADQPQVNIQQLNQLIRQAAKETEHDQPPASSRKLFRYLREMYDNKDNSDETEF